MQLNLPNLTDVLEEIEFIKREQMDRQVIELAILLYTYGVSLRKVARVLGWLNVERSHVVIWSWIQKFGQCLTEAGRRPAADLPAVVLMDETVISQRGEEFTLFTEVNPKRIACCARGLKRRGTRSQLGEFQQEPPSYTGECRQS